MTPPRFAFAALLILLAPGCASQPKADNQLEVSVRRVDAGSRRHPTTDLIYEVSVGNDSGETIFLAEIALEPWQDLGLFRRSSTHPNVRLESGEYRDFTVFAEVDSRGVDPATGSAMVGDAPIQMRVLVTYRIGTKEHIESHDAATAPRRRGAR